MKFHHRIIIVDGEQTHFLRHWISSSGIVIEVSGPKSLLLHEHNITELNGLKLNLMSLTEWLKRTPNTTDVRGCQLTVCGQTFEAARYTQTFHYEPGMSAVSLGKKTVDETYSQTLFYVVGERPKKLKENRKTLDGMLGSKYDLRFPDDDGDWYTACYINGDALEPQFAQYHPFGANFILSRWPHEEFQQRIDHHEKKKYPRLPVEVQWAES